MPPVSTVTEPLTATAPSRALLTGWGRTAPSAAEVRHLSDPGLVEEQLRAAVGRGMIARGLGRSYGDAAQRAGGIVLDVLGLDQIGTADLSSGEVNVGGGVSLGTLMATFVPLGWFLPVTPGTRFVTVGGAIAADVHGKNHHRDGGFASHVRDLRLATPSGTFDLSPGDDLFWATGGGMGLTGVIVSARVRLTRVETSRMRVDTERARDLDHLLALMEEGDQRYRYSVAWIDCLAEGRRLGRAVLSRADHASLDDLKGSDRRDPLAIELPTPFDVPFTAPNGLLNRLSIKAFNEAYYRKAPAREVGRIEPIRRFFHPLDRLGGWNRLYGPRGFVQYQLVVPFGAEEDLRRILERLSGAGCASFLAVLKRFGPANPGPLSFPMAGLTLALDLPAAPGLAALLDGVDEIVASAEGRVYLAKDSRLRPDLLEAMYPRLGEWREQKRRVDPEGVLRSDLSERLRLVEDTAAGSGAARRDIAHMRDGGA